MDKERVGKINSYIEGPRWAGTGSFIKKLAIQLNLEATVETDKGFLRETVFFTIEGKESNLKRFKNMMTGSLEEYNE